MNKKDFNKLRRYAIIDNAECQYILAGLYLNDKKYQNIDKAIFWYTKSQELGYAKSMLQLGLIYSNRQYNVYDKNLAIYLLNQAYEHGEFTASMYLMMLQR